MPPRTVKPRGLSRKLRKLENIAYFILHSSSLLLRKIMALLTASTERQQNGAFRAIVQAKIEQEFIRT